MFRATIHATEESDVEMEVSAFRAKVDQAGLAPMVAELIVKQVGDVLTQLVANGRKLAAMGSQMQVTREIADQDYLVRVEFGTGRRRSWLHRIVDAIRGR